MERCALHCMRFPCPVCADRAAIRWFVLRYLTDSKDLEDARPEVRAAVERAIREPE